MERRITLNSSKPLEYYEVHKRHIVTSVVCTPTSATYNASFTCSPSSLAMADRTWVPIAALTAKTDQQNAELGKITGLKFERTAGTGSVIVDLVSHEDR